MPKRAKADSLSLRANQLAGSQGTWYRAQTGLLGAPGVLAGKISQHSPRKLEERLYEPSIAQLWSFVYTLRRLWKGVDTSLGTVQHGKL